MRLQQCRLHLNSVYRLAFTLLLDVSTKQRSSVPGEHLIVSVGAPQALPPLGFTDSGDVPLCW